MYLLMQLQMHPASFTSGIGYLGNMYTIGHLLCTCLCFNKNIRKLGGFNHLYINILFFNTNIQTFYESMGTQRKSVVVTITLETTLTNLFMCLVKNILLIIV